jgi:hypothetical protein
MYRLSGSFFLAAALDTFPLGVQRGAVGSTTLSSCLITWLVREERCLVGPWSVSVRANLRPPVSEDVTQIPTGLNSRTQKFLVGTFAIPSVLSETEEHLGQGPTRFQELVRLLCQVAALLHKSVT